MQSKWLFLSVSLISLALSVLPEFISDETKTKAKNILGFHYDVVWLFIFLSLGTLFIYLAWKQSKSEKANPTQNSTISMSSNKTTNYKIKQKNKYGDNIGRDKIVRK